MVLSAQAYPGGFGRKAGLLVVRSLSFEEDCLPDVRTREDGMTNYLLQGGVRMARREVQEGIGRALVDTRLVGDTNCLEKGSQRQVGACGEEVLDWKEEARRSLAAGQMQRQTGQRASHSDLLMKRDHRPERKRRQGGPRTIEMKKRLELKRGSHWSQLVGQGKVPMRWKRRSRKGRRWGH